MNEMKIKTAAKINLALDVTGKLTNGYHTIESVFQTIGLYDEVTVEMTEPHSPVIVTCEVPDEFSQSDPIPCDERNIAYKAAKAFLDENNFISGCRIHIKKGIPSQAGMGGGSTDAAAVIYCLSKMTGEKLAAPEKLGADVPFFLTGGTAYVEGIGEKITSISDYSGRILVIAKGKEGVSTAEAYRSIDSLANPLHPQAKKLAEAINSAEPDVHRYFGNLFEQAVQLEEVDHIKSVMFDCGALSAVMTGSGSAVFGLFESSAAAGECVTELKKLSFFAQQCKTVDNAFIELE